MRKVLIVVDMQNDFVTGSLGTKEAEAIVGKVVEKVKKCREEGVEVLFTRDTQTEQYLETQEGKKLPEATLAVDGACCAGVTPESHQAALMTMKMCQIEVK